MAKSAYRKLIAIMCLLALLSFSSCSMRQSTLPGESASSTMVQQPSSDVPEETPDVQLGSSTEIEPSAQPEPEPTPEVTEAPDPNAYNGPDLAGREMVEDDFFSDAVFFGNSLVNGLELYGKMGDGDFCCATSASVISVTSTKNAFLSNGNPATLLDAMLQKQYGKIYILLGINEIGFDVGYFAEVYSDMLTRIEEAQPQATIYIMGLTPVTKAKSDAGAPFTMERIELYNDALYELAREHECYYVDLVDALADSTGYLPASDSTDGVHFTVAKYPQWADYLRTHYAGDPDDVLTFEQPDPTYTQETPPAEPSPETDPTYTQDPPAPEPSEEPVPEESPKPSSSTDLQPEEKITEDESE